MAKRITVAAIGLLGVSLACWAALAWGQSSFKPPLAVIKGSGVPAATPAAAAPDPGQLPDPDKVKPPVSTGTATPPATTGPAAPLPTLPPATGPVAPPPTPAAPPAADPTITPSLSSIPPVPEVMMPLPVPPAPKNATVPTVPTPPKPAIPQPTPALPTPPEPPAAEVLLVPPARTPEPQAGLPVPYQPMLPPPPVQPTMPLKPVAVIEEAKPAELPLTPDTPLGRQEPALGLEWIGPAVAKVGLAQDYVLALRNTSNTPVQEVMVRVSIPAPLKVEATEPKGEVENNVLVWHLGTMLPRQAKNIQVKLTGETHGEANPKAWVTFTGMSVLNVKLREPKLVLQAAAPEKVLIGDAATFTLTVSNPGDGAAEQVKIHAKLSEGLDHGRGNEVNFEIGNLAGGESRSVQLICGTRAGGLQKVDCMAEADAGLTAGSLANVSVIIPRLDVQLVGPGLRYLDRKALYTLRVTNPGDAAATNVTVGDVLPAGFKVLAASDGGRHDHNTRTVSWFLGEIAPGQTREVQFEAQAVETGDQKHRARAVGARGLVAESELTTRVDGISELTLEVANTENPVEVGGEAVYDVRVTNTGSKTETDVKLVTVMPDKMEFKSSRGPAQCHALGKTVVFDPIDKLAPHQEVGFKVNAKALEPGTVQFKALVTSTYLADPVLKMETTRIYSDAPEGKTPGGK